MLGGGVDGLFSAHTATELLLVRGVCESSFDKYEHNNDDNNKTKQKINKKNTTKRYIGKKNKLMETDLTTYLTIRLFIHLLPKEKQKFDDD